MNQTHGHCKSTARQPGRDNLCHFSNILYIQKDAHKTLCSTYFTLQDHQWDKLLWECHTINWHNVYARTMYQQTEGFVPVGLAEGWQLPALGAERQPQTGLDATTNPQSAMQVGPKHILGTSSLHWATQLSIKCLQRYQTRFKQNLTLELLKRAQDILYMSVGLVMVEVSREL